jgi:hypothetical protein
MKRKIECALLFCLAVLRYGRIYKTCACRSWRDAFTVNKGTILMWFNCGTGSTHILRLSSWRKQAHPKHKQAVEIIKEAA